MQHFLIAEINADVIDLALAVAEKDEVARSRFLHRQQFAELLVAAARQAVALLRKNVLDKAGTVKTRFLARAAIAVAGTDELLAVGDEAAAGGVAVVNDAARGGGFFRFEAFEFETWLVQQGGSLAARRCASRHRQHGKSKKGFFFHTIMNFMVKRVAHYTRLFFAASNPFLLTPCFTYAKMPANIAIRLDVAIYSQNSDEHKAASAAKKSYPCPRNTL